MKKQPLALCLCICLALSLLSGVSAAGSGLAANELPSFQSAMGNYFTEYPDENFAQYYDETRNPMTCDDLLRCAREYVDLVVERYPFEVVSAFDNNDYGGTKTCYLRYTGTAGMSENLQFGDSIDWFHYGPYHLKVSATEYKDQCWLTVAWDEGLRAVETDERTPTGERLGKARPSLTVVLALNYPKMAVGGEVVAVDSGNAQVCPIEEDGRTLVPVSRIVAAMGGSSSWDDRTQTAVFTLDEAQVVVPIGARTITVNGARRTLDVGAKLLHDRTYAPLRAVLEGLGLWVGYEPVYRLVVVSTDDLSGVDDLVELAESQRLFASEEVPEIPRHTKESYTLDGGQFAMEVGEALSLYNARTPISTYYSYNWEVLDGGELVHLDRNDATCKFYAKRQGTVTVRVTLEQWVQGYVGDDSIFNNEQTFTITITPATEQGSGGGLMTWQTCPSCNGVGTIRSGTRQIQCPTCLGRKQVLMH